MCCPKLEKGKKKKSTEKMLTRIIRLQLIIYILHIFNFKYYAHLLRIKFK